MAEDGQGWLKELDMVDMDMTVGQPGHNRIWLDMTVGQPGHGRIMLDMCRY